MSKKLQGFAALTPERRRALASKGGLAAHARGTAHKWTSDEARIAGRKGGSLSRRRPRQAPLPFASNMDVGPDVPGGGAA